MGAVNMHMTLEVAREKVAAGAAFLDDLPATAKDWRASIDRVCVSRWAIRTSVFSASSSANYYDAANELGLSKAQQSNFGFMYWGSGTLTRTEAMEDAESWGNLAIAWREEIA
jgi:hypothetical protein